MTTIANIDVRTTATEDGIALVTVRGELGLAEASALRSALGPLVQAGSVRFILDLSGVPYLDSAALRVLVELYRQVLPRQGCLWVAGATAPVQRTLEITRFTKLFGMAGTTAEALEAIRQQDAGD